MKHAILLGLLLLLPTASNADAAAKKPNLIVIMVDDMGYAGVSCFGNPYFKTPEIDRLAAEGMRFTDFHSSGTVCSPTRAGLLTGRYQQRAGIEAVIHPVSDHPEHRKGLKRSEITFAEVLKDAGYTTGLIGKWHQGYPQNSDEYHPQNHGFDEFIGYHSGNIDFVSHVGDHYQHDWWHGRMETNEVGYSTHLINRHSIDFVRRHAKADKPFCLYVAHEAIHNPVQVPGDPVRRTLKDWDRWQWRKVSKEERIEKYKGMTLPIDEGIGELRKTLFELGIEKNTFVLFFSDNGPAGDFPSGSPRFRGGKGTVYEGGHRVPAIAWWPGKIKAGTVSDIPLISIDVMPALLSLAKVTLREPGRPLTRPSGTLAPSGGEGRGEGASRSKGTVRKARLLESPRPVRKLDGVDFSPVFLKQTLMKPRPLYWASLSNSGQRSEALRDGEWKLVVQHPKAKPVTFANEQLELFNLNDDPGEKTNLAEKHPQRADAMLKQLKAWYRDTQSTATPQPGGWLVGKE